jgi:predicted dehydrogenase
MNSLQTRRQFLGQTSVAAAGLGLGLALSPRTYAAKGANEKIVFGLIGAGGMGRENMKQFMTLQGVEIGAIADVDDTHTDRAAKMVTDAGRPAPKKYRDFRDLVDQKDIDAVIIGTPDHWHALPFIAACEAGKDIYCEKPISHDFIEAKAMLSAARHFKPVVQVGTWQRSMNHFQKAIEFVQSGKLGKIAVCRAWNFNQNKPIGHQTPQPVPGTLDYDFWLGPAAKTPYQPNRCHYTWRNFFEFGGGLMTDWGVHMIDIVLLAMKADPVRVSATGGVFSMDDDRNAPDTMQAVYQFPTFTLNWEQRHGNQRGMDGGRSHGSEFIGSKGTLIVDRESYQFFPNPDEKDAEAPPKCENTASTHWQNFIDCVKSRETPRSGIESMAHTTMVCHLGNIAYQAGKAVQWDANNWEITNRSDVKHCMAYEREYRKPWKLKTYKA